MKNKVSVNDGVATSGDEKVTLDGFKNYPHEFSKWLLTLDEAENSMTMKEVVIFNYTLLCKDLAGFKEKTHKKRKNIKKKVLTIGPKVKLITHNNIYTKHPSTLSGYSECREFLVDLAASSYQFWESNVSTSQKNQ